MKVVPDPMLGPTHPDDRPVGYRDPNLTNGEALDMMEAAAVQLSDRALAIRHWLLAAGFADDHSMCRELDNVARDWTIKREVIIRQRSDYQRLADALTRVLG